MILLERRRSMNRERIFAVTLYRGWDYASGERRVVFLRGFLGTLWLAAEVDL